MASAAEVDPADVPRRNAPVQIGSKAPDIWGTGPALEAAVKAKVPDTTARVEDEQLPQPARSTARYPGGSVACQSEPPRRCPRRRAAWSLVRYRLAGQTSAISATDQKVRTHGR